MTPCVRGAWRTRKAGRHYSVSKLNLRGVVNNFLGLDAEFLKVREKLGGGSAELHGRDSKSVGS